MGPQVDGVTGGTNIEEELDNWDENAADDDWEEEEHSATANGRSKSTTAAGVEADGTRLDDKKRDA